jgi:hypothetical protein
MSIDKFIRLELATKSALEKHHLQLQMRVRQSTFDGDVYAGLDAYTIPIGKIEMLHAFAHTGLYMVS